MFSKVQRGWRQKAPHSQPGTELIQVWLAVSGFSPNGDFRVGYSVLMFPYVVALLLAFRMFLGLGSASTSLRVRPRIPPPLNPAYEAQAACTQLLWSEWNWITHRRGEPQASSGLEKHVLGRPWRAGGQPLLTAQSSMVWDRAELLFWR